MKKNSDNLRGGIFLTHTVYDCALERKSLMPAVNSYDFRSFNWWRRRWLLLLEVSWQMVPHARCGNAKSSLASRKSFVANVEVSFSPSTC